MHVSTHYTLRTSRGSGLCAALCFPRLSAFRGFVPCSRAACFFSGIRALIDLRSSIIAMKHLCFLETILMSRYVHCSMDDELTTDTFEFHLSNVEWCVLTPSWSSVFACSVWHIFAHVASLQCAVSHIIVHCSSSRISVWRLLAQVDTYQNMDSLSDFSDSLIRNNRKLSSWWIGVLGFYIDFMFSK